MAHSRTSPFTRRRHSVVSEPCMGLPGERAGGAVNSSIQTPVGSGVNRRRHAERGRRPLAVARGSVDDACMHAYSDRPGSLWWNDVHDAHAPLSGRVEADVVIVGGGITGVTLAWTLAARDTRVLLLEAGFVAGAASGRNAGYLMAGPARPSAG